MSSQGGLSPDDFGGRKVNFLRLFLVAIGKMTIFAHVSCFLEFVLQN